ncbi:DUF3784 domain-containing protein [Halalkalicoccus jeotgali]|uniref:DUF3784 domain-containing protein n=1 Tax=Halalkalicoccus jeotgali (strain DSM 18796 / CECT 7217 / JCM 14584 / KCTC 4019 / B3) TaxID=795797 RepID=D8J802_HALJB|nr:DUF3784 domain-containing protein [Halalkalicoccus jeotgali]ADJ14115.1 hypothetical protein HacjB3_03620 [Halalkalicoccus jeotgali B3]ELY34703.1 hypothetical protein C497_15673 [Halalkalicoccus jeotgali B3]
MSLALAVVLWVSGFALVGLGLLVREGHPELISGYDPEAVRDPEGLAAFVGRWTVVLGIALVASGFVPEARWEGTFVVGFVGLTLAVSVWLLVGARRYA